ncbi:MAG: [Fe-S]-binding protein, partial [Candidatus Binatia bacterium]
MLTIGEKILFILFVVASLYFGAKGFLDVYKIIGRGRPDQRFDNLSERIRSALRIVFTQRSVFKTSPV